MSMRTATQASLPSANAASLSEQGSFRGEALCVGAPEPGERSLFNTAVYMRRFRTLKTFTYTHAYA